MSVSPVCSCLSCPIHAEQAGRPPACGFYPSSSLTDAQWALLEPLPPPGNTGGRGGRPEKHDRRRVLDVIFYLVRGGIAWVALPAELRQRRRSRSLLNNELLGVWKQPDDRGRAGLFHPEHVVMDAEATLGRLLPPGSVYAFLAEHRRRLFPDAMFADRFPSPLGRPSVPADVIAAVLVLQALEGRSDREAVEALTFDLRWKVAVGLPIGSTGFHPTVLTYWRRRLAASARPQRIFDAVPEVVAATGALSGKTRRALDATVLEDAVATQDTVTQLIAAIRRVRREVPGATEVVAAHCTAHDYDDPGKPQIAWNDPDARAALVDALVGDAHRLLGHLPEAGALQSQDWR